MVDRFRTRADCDLVLVARLYPRLYRENGSFRDPGSASLEDVGFADGANLPIAARQPAETPLDKWTWFDWLEIEPDETCRGIGKIGIRERFAYDTYYRSEVPWTGILVEMRLAPSAFATYLNYLGDLTLPKTRNLHDWSSVIFRIPVTKFALPVRRGGLSNEDKAKVGKLREVTQFNFETVEIQKLSNREGGEVQVRDGLPQGGNELPPPLILG